MSRLPRTPVHFPRMKVRGRRNKRKLRERITTRFFVPHLAIAAATDLGGGVFDTTMRVARAEEATHSAEWSVTHDGFGRVVPNPPPPPPSPPAGQSFAMEFTMEPGAGADLWELLTGRAGLTASDVPAHNGA